MVIGSVILVEVFSITDENSLNWAIRCGAMGFGCLIIIMRI